ncbi:MAG TPA: response regulator [Vicinamibacterales bacterium]|nr:response regulator [Vicinamibacterales bacterium]
MPDRSRGGGKPPLILVVDDNLDAREMYCTYLRHEGFDCIEAEDGAEALRLTRAHRPVVVLMDATMPGVDGWQAIQQLRSEPELRGTAVVMLTAHAFDEHRRRAEAVGADAFLAKPVLPDELANQIRDLLRLA